MTSSQISTALSLYLVTEDNARSFLVLVGVSDPCLTASARTVFSATKIMIDIAVSPVRSLTHVGRWYLVQGKTKPKTFDYLHGWIIVRLTKTAAEYSRPNARGDIMRGRRLAVFWIMMVLYTLFIPAPVPSRRRCHTIT